MATSSGSGDGRRSARGQRSPASEREACAVALLGPFDGHGLRPGTPLAGAQVFVMPGPMEERTRVNSALRGLKEWWESS